MHYGSLLHAIDGEFHLAALLTFYVADPLLRELVAIDREHQPAHVFLALILQVGGVEKLEGHRAVFAFRHLHARRVASGAVVGDEKIIAVPSSKLTQRYDKIRNVGDLPEITVQQIQHFFEHYKDLEKGKWVKVLKWGDAAEAHKLIVEGIEGNDTSLGWVGFAFYAAEAEKMKAIGKVNIPQDAFIKVLKSGD